MRRTGYISIHRELITFVAMSYTDVLAVTSLQRNPKLVIFRDHSIRVYFDGLTTFQKHRFGVFLSLKCQSLEATSPEWGSWTEFGVCSRVCGGGIRRRSRECVGGVGCDGLETDSDFCNTRACSFDDTGLYL